MPDDDTTRTRPVTPGPFAETRPLHRPAAGGRDFAPPGFDVLDELGAGGMGVVYRARQTSLNRVVALKTLKTADADPAELVRFWAEAEIVAAIDHPNVVAVYEFSRDPHMPYLAMEYLPNGSLADRLRGAVPMAARDAAAVVEKVARGVAAAHARGVVHRDLKPQNVLFDADREPKVTDFGLAKRPTDPGSGRSMTDTGAVFGTPSYMAPEQASGNAKFAGPPADVWALGVILYECLTGSRPFTGNSYLDVLAKVQLDDPVSVRAVVKSVPRQLETVCLKCLAKEPARRYPTAAELADDLRRFRAGEPVSARRTGRVEGAILWARRKPTLAAAAGLGGTAVVLSAFAAGLGVLWWQAKDARAAAEADRQVAVTARDGEAEARAAADAARDRERGQRETAEAREKQADDARREAEAQKTRADAERAAAVAERIRADEQARKAEDAAFLAVREKTRADDARKSTEAALAANTRLAAELAGTQYARTVDLAFREFAAGNPEKARALAADTPPARRGWEWAFLARVTRPPAATLRADGREAYFAAFVPKTRRLLTAHDDGTVRMWDPDAGTEVRVFDGLDAAALEVAAAPDGARVVASTKAGEIRVWDADTGRELPGPKLAGPFPADGTRAVNAVAFNRDGKLLATGSQDGFVRVYDASSWKELFAADAGLGPIHVVRYSPFAPRLAAAGKSGVVRTWDWTTGELKEAARPADVGAVHALAFDPAGRLAAAGETGKIRVWNLAADTTLAFEAHPGGAQAVAFDAAGVLYSGGRDRCVRSWHPDAGVALAEFRGADGDVWAVDVSADGKRIAAADLAGKVRVWDATAPPDGRGFAALGGANGAAVSPDGKRLLVPGRDHVTLWDLDAGTAVVLKPKPRLAAGTRADGTKFVGFQPPPDLPGGKVQPPFPVAPVPKAAAPDESEPDRPAGFLAAGFAPDGREVVAADDRGFVTVWDATTHAVLETKRPLDAVSAAAFDAASGRLFLANGSGGGGILNARTRTAEAVFITHPKPITAAAFGPDGKFLVTADAAGHARLWDVAGRKEVARTPAGSPHAGRVTGVAAAAGGRHFATCGEDGKARLWDGTTGELLRDFRGDRGKAWAIAVSPDGTRIATGGDGTVKIWDAATGAELITVGSFRSAVVALGFTPDGSKLVATTRAGLVKFLDAAPPPAGPEKFVTGRRPDPRPQPAPATTAGGTTQTLPLPGTAQPAMPKPEK